MLVYYHVKKISLFVDVKAPKYHWTHCNVKKNRENWEISPCSWQMHVFIIIIVIIYVTLPNEWCDQEIWLLWITHYGDKIIDIGTACHHIKNIIEQMMLSTRFFEKVDLGIVNASFSHFFCIPISTRFG